MSYTMSPDLNFVSWNVGGLNTPVKRKKILTQLKRLNPDVIYLQETHWLIDKSCTLKAPWLDACYSADYTSKTRGVAILFKKGLSYQIQDKTIDPLGRFILLSVDIDNSPHIFW